MKKTKYAIEVNDLTVAYKDKPVIWDVDMDVPKGILLAIVGPNGAGKSTLLKSILGLLKPAAGSVKIFGQEYSQVRTKVAYVPQRGSVDWDFPTTALDVVLMGRYGHIGWIKRPSKNDKDLALKSLEKVSMQNYADRQISQLSGGQQQRVFLARALVQDADLYLLDEPFVGVDATTEKAIISLLQELRKQGKTVVVVHHDIQTLKQYYDWALLLNVRRIALGPVSKVLNTKSLQLTYGGKASFLTEIEQK